MELFAWSSRLQILLGSVTLASASEVERGRIDDSDEPGRKPRRQLVSRADAVLRVLGPHGVAVSVPLLTACVLFKFLPGCEGFTPMVRVAGDGCATAGGASAAIPNRTKKFEPNRTKEFEFAGQIYDKSR